VIAEDNGSDDPVTADEKMDAWKIIIIVVLSFYALLFFVFILNEVYRYVFASVSL